MSTIKTPLELFNAVASLYQERFMDMDLYDDTYDLFCSYIPKHGAEVLEIGCGPGNITRYLLNKRPDFRILGIDFAPNMITLAKANNPSATFMVMDCKELNTLAGSFDAVICGFCLPYLSKEECAAMIGDCKALIPAGGVMYLSMIEGDYERSGYETGSTGDATFVYLHQEDHLRQILEENQFEPVEVTRKYYQKADGTESCHLIMIARKK